MDLIQRKQIANTGTINPAEKSNILFRKTLSTKDLPGFAGGLETMTSGAKSIFGNRTYEDLNPEGVKPKKSGGSHGSFDAGAAIGGTLQTIGAINAASQYNRTAADFIGSAGSSEGSINGVSFKQLNDIDEGSEMSRVSQENTQATLGAAASGASAGAAIGTVAGPIGTAVGGVLGGIVGGIGGILGGSSRKRKAEQALEQARRRQLAINLTNRDKAGTAGLQQMFMQNYGNLEDQSLFAAAEGKESGVDPITGSTFENFVVNTPYGKLFGPQNAWVSKGEVIKSKDGSLYRVKAGKNDTARAYLQDTDTVFSAKVINPETGNPIAKDVFRYAETGQLDRLEQNQQIGRELQQMKNITKYRRLPGFDNGKPSWLAKAGQFIGNNILPNIDGNLMATVGNLVAANSQYREANEPLHETDVYEYNPYERKALNDLYGLHQDYYPIARQNREIEGRGYNQIVRSGGLSTGQKMKLGANMAYNTQMSNADALRKNNVQNNAYIAQAANAALNAGQNSAQRKMQANMFNEEMLAKAHNASLQGKQMSLFNAMNALSQYYKNNWEKKQFKDTLALYRDDLEQRRKDVETKNNGNQNDTWSIVDKDTYNRILSDRYLTPRATNYDYYQKQLGDYIASRRPQPQIEMPVPDFMKMSLKDLKKRYKKNNKSRR